MFELLLIIAMSSPVGQLPMLDLKPTHNLYRTMEACQAAGDKAKSDGVPVVKGFICRAAPGMTEV